MSQKNIIITLAHEFINFRQNQLLCALGALLMWVNLMHHCGVDMRDDSLIFSRVDILAEILKGNYGKPVVYKKDAAEEARRLEAEDEDDPEYSPYRYTKRDSKDTRTTNAWANRTLKTVMDAVIPFWRDERDANGNPSRRFGTHTAKKTGVLMYAIGGQVSTGQNGKEVWTDKLDLEEFCKVFHA